MRRGGHDSVGPRPTFKTAAPTNSTATTPRSQHSTSRSQHSTSNTPRAQRASAARGTILVNLDVLIHRTNIGRDISPADEDLIVLFRRNSKEVTSEPARWSADHCAVWNQHVNLQTSLLRHKKPQGASGPDFLKKEYEIVLVALPSHSAVALFSVDFATLVQLGTKPADRHKSFRVSPVKCRDLAATLEFDITWDFVHAPDSSQATTDAPKNMMLHPSANPHTVGLAGLPPSSTLLGKSTKTQTPKAQTPRTRETSKSRRATNDTSSVSTRRTTASLSSHGSDRELLEELSASNCTSCRSAKRRLDRKEVQVGQLESFLKESQRRIDALATENDELLIREKAETRNAAQQRALSLRLLQELEAAVQLCHNQMQTQDTTLLPQMELIERVKKFHQEVDPLHGRSKSSCPSSHGPPTAFDFRAETEAAMQRNLRLQQQLEFLGRSMDYESETVEGDTRTDRAATDTSGTTTSSAQSGSVTVDVEARPVALTMTQQLNNLERENFKLRAELGRTLANAASALKKHSFGFPSGLASGLSLTAEVSETTSSSSREDIEEPEGEDAALLTRIREQHELEAGRSAVLESELAAAKSEIQKLKDQLEAVQNDSASTEEKEKERTQRAPGFLDKIYNNVGKAKVGLDDRVKQLDDLLASATEENRQLRNEIERCHDQMSDSHDQASAAETDAHIAGLERLLKVREKEQKATETELARTKKQLREAEARARADQKTKSELKKELAGVRLSLKTAQETTAHLEDQLATRSASAAHSSVASDSAAHDELADVKKRLKLSKQEVMQLRFRSNQLESVNERLEVVLKEKRTLEVKLTALEGQLFEQRSRTDNSSIAAHSLDAKSSSMLSDMQRELDQKDTELMVAERKVTNLRAQLDGQGGEAGNMGDVADKVKRFENEIRRLCQRNDEQARRLEKLGGRVTVAIRERDELEVIVDQMVAEMALLGKNVNIPAAASRRRRTPATPDKETEKKAASSIRRRPPPVQTGKITDRYATAVASSSSHTPASSSTPGAVKSNKVAQLMKNFSAPNSDSDSPAVSSSVKRPTKLDGKGSAASRSNGKTPTSRLRRVPSKGPQLF